MTQHPHEDVEERIEDAVHFFNEAENTPSDSAEATLASLQSIACSQIAIAKMMALNLGILAIP